MIHHRIRPACSYGFAVSSRERLAEFVGEDHPALCRIISSYDDFFSVFSYACA